MCGRYTLWAVSFPVRFRFIDMRAHTMILSALRSDELRKFAARCKARRPHRPR
jgi:hypothetical protein